MGGNRVRAGVRHWGPGAIIGGQGRQTRTATISIIIPRINCYSKNNLLFPEKVVIVKKKKFSEININNPFIKTKLK